MPVDDEAARHARAKQLRETIEQIKAATEAPEESDDDSTSAPLSPREFIHKRMWEEAKKGGPKPPIEE